MAGDDDLSIQYVDFGKAAIAYLMKASNHRLRAPMAYAYFSQ